MTIADSCARLERADRIVASRMGRAVDHWTVRLLGGASEAADQPPLITLCAATFATGLLLRNRRLAEAGGRMLAAELTATAIKDAIKSSIDRTRPHVEAEGGQYRAGPGQSDESALNSFPSGHTAGAVAVARAVGHVYPGARGPALALAGAVAAVQVPRLKHYPTDLVAGAAVGFLADVLVSLAARQLTRRLSR